MISRKPEINTRKLRLSTMKKFHTQHVECNWHLTEGFDISHTLSLTILQSITIIPHIITRIQKVKWSRYRPSVAQRVGRGIALLFHDRGTRRGWVVSSTPRPHFYPRERHGTYFTGGWVDPRAGLFGRKISSPPGFDSGPSSRYTDWATRPTNFTYILLSFLNKNPWRWKKMY